MFTLESLRELYVHMEWAESLVWQAVMSSETVAADDAIREKLAHIHRTQQYFLKVWRDETVEFRKIERTLAEELSMARQYHVEVMQHLSSLDVQALNRDMKVPWADYFAQKVGRSEAAVTTLGQTIFQACAHSTYHRGQLNTRLRELGVEPPLVDYIAWLWLGRPEASWPPSTPRCFRT